MALNIGWPMYSFENKNLQIKVWKVVNLKNHNSRFQMQMRQIIFLVYRNIGECNKLFLNHLNYSIFFLKIGLLKYFMNYLKAMKASPCSPPTMCTPPSGMARPWKYVRMSRALADHGRFCNLMITLMAMFTCWHNTVLELLTFFKFLTW